MKAREKILDAAYELFSQRGIQAVGIDLIVQRADVARMSLYRNFDSKEDLVIAFLKRREELWLRDWLQAEVERRSVDPRERLLAVFDVFDQWFRRAEFEGCSFINILLETAHSDDHITRASISHLAEIRKWLESLAAAAGVRDANTFARKWHILMKGAIIAAAEGDLEAARLAQELGAALLRSEAD